MRSSATVTAGLTITLLTKSVEREHIRRAVETITRVAGERPVGWMTGRPGPNTRRLFVEAGGFLYDRDALNDELPYWVEVAGHPHLVIPYSYETNDNRCDQSHGFAHADDFFQYLRDAFDLLYEEGAEHPRLLSIGLHDRLIGRPARATGLIKFLDYVRSFERVWFCRGIDIARHWRQCTPTAIVCLIPYDADTVRVRLWFSSAPEYG